MNIFVKFGQLLCMATIATSIGLSASASSGNESGSKWPFIKKVATFQGFHHPFHDVRVFDGLAFDPYGELIASAHEGKDFKSPHGVHLWNLKTGARADLMLPASTKGKNIVRSLVFFPSGKLLAGKVIPDNRPGDNQQVMLWDVDTRKAVAQYTNIGYVISLAISPDGKKLTTGGAYRELDCSDGWKNNSLAHKITYIARALCKNNT